jgi:CubicO group peptidase (beta-lactamase class C family)
LADFTRTIASSLLAVLLVGCADRNQSRTTPLAASDRREPRLARFRQQLEADRERLRIPGLSVVILEDGEVLWAEGLGHADVERRVPATPDTLYHIASVTKTFTAILVLQLVEKGKLDLDAPVSRYVPEIKDDRVRIKHLLSHTSEGTPGERFSYNPDRFEHLKAILERATGKPLRVMIVETFLDPLAMRDSVPGPDVADDPQKWAVLGADNLERYRRALPRFAQPYTYYGHGETVHVAYPPRDFWASAGLLSTVRDLAKYDAAVDRHAFLGEAMQNRAWTSFLSNADEPLAHGLGWYVTDYRSTRLVWHYGHWGTGFSAIYLKIPARRLTLIMLTNSEALADHHFQVGQDITHNVFACTFVNVFVPEVANAPSSERGTPPADATPADKTSTAPSTDCERTSRSALAKWLDHRRTGARVTINMDPEEYDAYLGRYELNPKRFFAATREGDRLIMDFDRGEVAELFPEAPDKFFTKGWDIQVTFGRDAKGSVTHLDIVVEGRPARRAKKVR